MFIHYYNSTTDHQYMEDWLKSLSMLEYKKYFNMANKDLNNEEIEFLSEKSLDVYCQEMALTVFEYDDKFLTDNLKLFITNIIIYSLKIKGLVKVETPISLYKDYVLEKTQSLIDLYS